MPLAGFVKRVYLGIVLFSAPELVLIFEFLLQPQITTNPPFIQALRIQY
jgi:hypothetical protein